MDTDAIPDWMKDDFDTFPPFEFPADLPDIGTPEYWALWERYCAHYDMPAYVGDHPLWLAACEEERRMIWEIRNEQKPAALRAGYQCRE